MMSALPPLSALAKFDDLMRCQKELSAGVAEEKFMIFLHQFDLIKHDYQRMVEEAQDLQGRLDAQIQQTISIERKLNYARKLLETERKAKREAENERGLLENKLETLRTLLLNDNTMKDETRKHLQVLSSYAAKKRKSAHHIDEEEFNDINSTGSFLSDLSLTQSGDDILDPKPAAAANQKWKKHRPSLNNSNFLNVSAAKKSRASVDKRRSTRLSLLDYGTEKIISQTKFTIPADKYAPIAVEAIVEPVSRVPPTPSTSSDDEPMKQTFFPTPTPKQFKTPMKTPVVTQSSAKRYCTPSAPSLNEIENLRDEIYATVIKKKPSVTATTSVISGRPHNFSSKTFLKPETCGLCSKKIRFGSVAFKCGECRTCIHQDCRDKFNVPCLPQNSTPVAAKTRFLGTINEYTPSISPMVPALIVHCVNEIETRGLTEAGLYRVSGSDRDVKALKEKFMRNNGIPNLQETDVHVLCGCIKDFLRSLSEPLIPLALWTMFSNATQSIPNSFEDADVNKDVYNAVEMLPPANRDTLAYLILHFQRISECPEVKMPISNFAKIFGPTIVGYSCANPDQHKVYAETQIQFSVMFSLLNIPTEYWNKFIALDTLTTTEELKAIDSYGSKFYSGTPSFKFSRKDRKFYNTPPYSSSKKKK